MSTLHQVRANDSLPIVRRRLPFQALVQLSRPVRRLLIALSVITATCAAPITRAAEQTIHFEPLAAEPPVPTRFALAAHDFVAVDRPLEASRWDAASVRELTFPSPVTTAYECNNTVHCEYFAPRGEGPHAGVVVLHILGGDFELSRTCCRSLAWHGVGALFLKMPYYGPRRPATPRVRMVSENLPQTVDSFTQAVVDIRRAAAWLAAQPDIDPQRLGVTGISLGGIVAALATAGEPRFQRACYVLAGGNLGQIILESRETEEVKRAWESQHWQRDAILQQLAQIDPLTYAANIKTRKLLMFNASEDEVVPPACTKALWQALEEPEIHWWKAGHYSAAWYLPPALIEMSTFFAAPTSSAAP